MDAVFPDLSPHAVKIGMLFDAPRARAVRRGLEKYRARRVVLDPVLFAKGGEALFAAGSRAALLSLLPLCDLVTPNLPEAEDLAGIAIRDEDGRRRAATLLVDRGARAVLIKDGHGTGATVSDLYFDGRRFVEFRHPRLDTRATHGTGCTLSAAIAANLALGAGLEAAVGRSIAFLERALRGGIYPGRGWGTPDRNAAATPSRKTRTRGPGTRSPKPR
jgi:hydroxymethylpyrimidine kinase/phosphomethylpyrimidine kinase